ncbi:hypothetical protein FRC00_010600, partial [Tulasnella sp. 408]
MESEDIEDIDGPECSGSGFSAFSAGFSPDHDHQPQILKASQTTSKRKEHVKPVLD